MIAKVVSLVVCLASRRLTSHLKAKRSFSLGAHVLATRNLYFRSENREIRVLLYQYNGINHDFSCRQLLHGFLDGHLADKEAKHQHVCNQCEDELGLHVTSTKADHGIDACPLITLIILHNGCSDTMYVSISAIAFFLESGVVMHNPHAKLIRIRSSPAGAGVRNTALSVFPMAAHSS